MYNKILLNYFEVEFIMKKNITKVILGSSLILLASSFANAGCNCSIKKNCHHGDYVYVKQYKKVAVTCYKKKYYKVKIKCVEKATCKERACYNTKTKMIKDTCYKMKPYMKKVWANSKKFIN